MATADRRADGAPRHRDLARRPAGRVARHRCLLPPAAGRRRAGCAARRREPFAGRCRLHHRRAHQGLDPPCVARPCLRDAAVQRGQHSVLRVPVADRPGPAVSVGSGRLLADDLPVLRPRALGAGPAAPRRRSLGQCAGRADRRDRRRLGRLDDRPGSGSRWFRSLHAREDRLRRLPSHGPRGLRNARPARRRRPAQRYRCTSWWRASCSCSSPTRSTTCRPPTAATTSAASATGCGWRATCSSRSRRCTRAPAGSRARAVRRVIG